MPYITQEDREYFLNGGLGVLVDSLWKEGLTAGDMNYIFTVLCRAYIQNKGEKYQHYNDLIGALEGCKLELYAKKIRPYEDKKVLENGDV